MNQHHQFRPDNLVAYQKMGMHVLQERGQDGGRVVKLVLINVFRHRPVHRLSVDDNAVVQPDGSPRPYSAIVNQLPQSKKGLYLSRIFMANGNLEKMNEFHPNRIIVSKCTDSQTKCRVQDLKTSLIFKISNQTKLVAHEAQFAKVKGLSTITPIPIEVVYSCK